MTIKRTKSKKISAFQNPLYSNPLTRMIKACDYYGQPIGLNFESKQTHQTVFGGVVTILVVIGFFSYFFRSMLRAEDFYHKDTISTNSYIYGFNNP